MRSTARMRGAARSAAVVALIVSTSIPLGALGEEPARPAPKCVDAPKGGPGDVVRALYAAYWSCGARCTQPNFWNEPREVLSRYFDPKLTAYFLADQACQARERMPCEMGFVDPLTGSNGWSPRKYRVCKSNRGADWIDVHVRFTEGHGIVVFGLVKTAAGWRIASIDDPGSRSPTDSDEKPPVTPAESAKPIPGSGTSPASPR